MRKAWGLFLCRSFLCLGAAGHFRSRDVTILINEIQVPGLLSHPHFMDLLSHLASPPFPAHKVMSVLSLQKD